MHLDLESLRSYCLKKGKSVKEDFPFDDTVLVLKAAQKIFILIRTDTHPLSINLKCDPGRAVELRDRFAAVSPGYHMNKKHWNTVTLDGTIPAEEVFAMIDHSYDLVAPSGKSPAVKKSRKRISRPSKKRRR